MASVIDKVQSRLQEAMDHGNQASLGQAIDASKGINGIKQLRRTAKARLKQLSADQNRNMIGSHMPPEEPLTWRTSDQGGRYRAVAHLPTSIIGWVIGHKGCNARMLKQQTGTELWVDVPGQCVVIEARVLHEVEAAVETVNSFVKTAPTFIAKIQAGSGGGITQTVQCPVHLLPSLQRLSRKIQAESGANCVFANSKMSTFCVTGDKKNVETAVNMIKRLIVEGNSEMLAAGSMGGKSNISSSATGNGSVVMGGNLNSSHLDRRGPGGAGIGMGARRVMLGMDLSQRLGRMGSDLSRSDESPATAPCSPDTSAINAWGNGAPTQLRSWSAHQQDAPVPPASSLPTPPGPSSTSSMSHGQMHPRCLGSAPATAGVSIAPFQGGPAAGSGSGGGGGASSDLSFFSFGVGGVGSCSSALGAGNGVSAPRASTAPAGNGNNGAASALGGMSPMILPGLGFLEESAGAGCNGNGGSCVAGNASGSSSNLGQEHDLDDERRTSSCGSGEFGGGEALGFPTHTRRPGSVGSVGAGGGGGGGGTGAQGGGGGGGCPLEGNIEDLLEDLGLSKYLPVFQSAEVDLGTLCIMSEQDFRELGILKGPRVKIMHHIGSR